MSYGGKGGRAVVVAGFVVSYDIDERVLLIMLVCSRAGGGEGGRGGEGCGEPEVYGVCGSAVVGGHFWMESERDCASRIPLLEFFSF